MTPEDIEKAIHDGISRALEVQLPTAVNAAIKTSVNGKVDALTKTMNDLTNDEETGKLDPILGVYNNWLSWKRGVAVWLGILLAIGGLISTIQTLWSFLSPHVTVK